MSNTKATPVQVTEVQDLIHRVVDVLLGYSHKLTECSGYGESGKLDWFRTLHQAEYQIAWWADQMQVNDAMSITAFRAPGPWPMLDVDRLIAGLRDLRAKMECEKYSILYCGSEAPINTTNRKKAGRKTIFDPKKDEKLHGDFVASQIGKIKEFAQSRGLNYRETDAALKRVRARRSRNKLS